MPVVLIVDDDPHTRLLVTTVLTHHGMRVLEAPDGATGIAAAGAHRPDLILLDLALPDANGAEILRRLRSNPVTRSLAVALYTASDPSTPAMRDFLSMYGVRHVVPKPSDPQTLLADVERALRHSTGS